MNWLLLCRMLGLLGALVGASMVFSLPWAFPVCGQTETFEARGFWGLVGAIACSLTIGGGLYLVGRRDENSILRKEALAVVGLGWLLAGVLGALPFLFAGVQRAPDVPMTIPDALFESISGFTTTGASVCTELEDPAMMPRCVMFWRCFTHWLGGMGIIVLFVAILGHLGAGGKALIKREVPGPINESVRPRVRHTALVMWGIYVGLSALETTLLMLEGVSLYHALCHSFGTMATGGFSTFNKSVGHFDGWLIEATIWCFMLLAGINFSLYYVLLFQPAIGGSGWIHRVRGFFRDPELRTYLGIIVTVTVLLTINLTWAGTYPNLLTSLRHSAFMAVTIITTTGFGTEDFTLWSEFSKGILLLLMFVGGCAGSTGGGMKVIRIMLLFKVLKLELERAFRPNVVRPLRLGTTTIDKQVRHDVIVYVCIVLMLFIFGFLLLNAIEPDARWQAVHETPAEKLIDCASAVASTLNNIGPGLGVLGPASNYSNFTAAGKLLLTLLMLLGRLELFAILVLFMPSFWRNQ